METVKCKVRDLYELRAQLNGFSVQQTTNAGAAKEEVKTIPIYTGFIHEKGITEGMKRLANKSLKAINEELTPIEKQRKELAENKDLSKDEINSKDNEILDGDVEFQTQLMDFSKVEDLSLSMNYEFLYEKLFKE